MCCSLCDPQALDVARVEIKRLRLERDLTNDRLRVTQDALKARGGLSSADLASWIVPNCLLHTGEARALVSGTLR